MYMPVDDLNSDTWSYRLLKNLAKILIDPVER